MDRIDKSEILLPVGQDHRRLLDGICFITGFCFVLFFTVLWIIGILDEIRKITPDVSKSELCQIAGTVILYACVIVCFNWLMLNSLLIGKVRYQFVEEGLLVKYWMRKWQLYRWDDFQEVCVAYFSTQHPRERDRDTCIFFAKKGSRPYAVFGGSRVLSPFFYKKVFALAYQDSLYEQLKLLCPYEVADKRIPEEW